MINRRLQIDDIIRYLYDFIGNTNIIVIVFPNPRNFNNKLRVFSYNAIRMYFDITGI